MRRRKPLQQGDKGLRRTPLARGDKPLARSALSPGRPPVKPRKLPTVTAAETAGRAAVRARSGGVCEIWMCGGARAHDWSHRVRRGQGGSWSPANGLDACRDCHSTITTHPWTCDAEAKGWALRSTAVPERTPCLRRGEWVWLLPSGGVEPLSAAELVMFGGAT